MNAINAPQYGITPRTPKASTCPNCQYRTNKLKAANALLDQYEQRIEELENQLFGKQGGGK